MCFNPQTNVSDTEDCPQPAARMVCMCVLGGAGGRRGIGARWSVMGEKGIGWKKWFGCGDKCLEGTDYWLEEGVVGGGGNK